MKKAFTLIELLVVTSIILLLSALIYPSYKSREEVFSLQRSVNKLAQDFRRAQESAMSAKEFQNLVPQGGYGIYLTTLQPDRYIFFADCNNNQLYDPTQTPCNGFPEKVEEIQLERRVKIQSPADLTITFVPPNPLVKISPDSPSVTISLTNDSQLKTITVNKAGLIEIQ